MGLNRCNELFLAGVIEIRVDIFVRCWGDWQQSQGPIQSSSFMVNAFGAVHVKRRYKADLTGRQWAD